MATRWAPFLLSMNYNKLVKLYPDYIKTYRSKIKTWYVSTFINLLWCLLNMIQINTAQIGEISIFVVYHVTVNQWWRYPYSLGPEVESRTQGSRPRTQKNLRPRTALPRTNPLEAKDRNARGQGQRHNAEVIFKKKTKVFAPKLREFSGKFRRSPKKSLRSSMAFFKTEQNWS